MISATGLTRVFGSRTVVDAVTFSVHGSEIVALLGPTPVSIDDLVRLAGRPPAVVRIVLLELEVAGRLQRHGGGLVSLV